MMGNHAKDNKAVSSSNFVWPEIISVTTPYAQADNIGSKPSNSEGTDNVAISKPNILDLEHAGTLKDESLHHPASTDDVLTHTIHLEDDQSLQSVTIRSMFLGKLISVSVIRCKNH